MNSHDISAVARHLFATRGADSIAEATRKAAAARQAGDDEQARIWQRVAQTLMEIRGPRQS